MSLQIKVLDSVFDPNRSPEEERTVYIRKADGGKWLYKVWLFLQGPDLLRVKKATYQLNSTLFSDPVRTVMRSASNQQCQSVIWTYGLFEVVTIIEIGKGASYEVVHKLSYDEELRQSDLKYHQVQTDPVYGQIRKIGKKMR